MKAIKTLSMLILTIILTSSSYASVIRYLSLEELCMNSTDVVEVKVLSTKSFYYGDKNPRMYTSIRLRVLKTYLGNCKENEIIEIIQYGGTINDKTIFQVDGPIFKVDQTSFLFLKEFVSEIWGRNYRVYGMAEGKFNIKEDKIYRDNIDGPLKQHKNGVFYSISRTTPMEKSIFINEIKKYMK